LFKGANPSKSGHGDGTVMEKDKATVDHMYRHAHKYLQHRTNFLKENKTEWKLEVLEDRTKI